MLHLVTVTVFMLPCVAVFGVWNCSLCCFGQCLVADIVIHVASDITLGVCYSFYVALCCCI